MLLGFECLNMWYVKTSCLNVMKLTAFTILNMRMLYFNFLSDPITLTRHYNFRLK